MDAKLRAGGVHRNTPEKEPRVPPQGDPRSPSRRTRRTPFARYARSNVSVASRSTTATRSARPTRLAVTCDTAVAAAALGLTLAMMAHGSGATRTLDALGVALA